MHRKKENIIKIKTLDFGKNIVILCRKIEEEHNEYVLSKQLKKSGTAPGALVRESEHAESRNDFIHKMSIALKEANECEYWFLLIFSGNYISKSKFNSVMNDCQEIIRILAAIVKSSKRSK